MEQPRPIIEKATLGYKPSLSLSGTTKNGEEVCKEKAKANIYERRYRRGSGNLQTQQWRHFDSLAKEKGIPLSTLVDWINGKSCGTEKRPTKKGRADHFRPGRPTKLRLQSEDHLASALKYLGNTGKCETDS